MREDRSENAESPRKNFNANPKSKERLKKSSNFLFHQKHGTRALDLVCDFAMQVSGHPCDATRDDLSAFRNKATEQIRVFVINRFDCEVDAPAGHRAVRSAEIRTALWRFRLHDILFFR